MQLNDNDADSLCLNHVLLHYVAGTIMIGNISRICGEIIKSSRMIFPHAQFTVELH